MRKVLLILLVLLAPMLARAASTTIDQLPPAINVSGADWVPIAQWNGQYNNGQKVYQTFHVPVAWLTSYASADVAYLTATSQPYSKSRQIGVAASLTATDGGAGATFTIGTAAHSGDCLSPANSLALTCTKTNGVSFAPSATTDATNASNISSGLLAVARGGTGTATPALVAGSNITITGSWPNQTIASASGNLTAGSNVTITGTWPNVTISSSAGATAGGSGGQIQYNSAGTLGGFTVSGDGTLNTGTGALTVTKTNGTSFGALATLTPGTGVTTALGLGANAAGGVYTYGTALPAASFPALTGDCTTTAGSLAVACAKIGGKNVTFGGDFSTIGAYALSLVLSGATTLTLPTTGVVASLGASQTWSAQQTFNSSNLVINGGTATAGLATVTSGGVVSSVAFAAGSDIYGQTDAAKPVNSSALNASAAQQTVTQTTSSATVDWRSGYNARIVLSASITSLTLSNPVDGVCYTLRVKQPSSGGPYTITWPASVNFGVAGTPILSTNANKIDMLTLCYSSADSAYHTTIAQGF